MSFAWGLTALAIAGTEFHLDLLAEFVNSVQQQALLFHPKLHCEVHVTG